MLTNVSSGQVLARRLRACDTFLKRGLGLMFRRRLRPDEALLFLEDRESVLGASIHMLFVCFPIAVIWLDASRRVVSTCLARPFRPWYAPAKPARYFVEGHPELLDKVSVGDEIAWNIGGAQP